MTGNEYIDDVAALNPDPRADIKEPIETILSKIIYILATDNFACDAILILLFNHIDLLGHLLSGDTSKANRAKQAVKFIRTYLGKVNEKYAMTGGFIYYMLGTGHIHKSYPRNFYIGDGSILRFDFSSTQKRQNHLSITQSDSEFRIIFSVNTFYQDLLSAIELYCLDMSSNRSLQEKYRLAWSQLTEPKDRSQLNNHAYILASDLGFINDQIS